MSYEIHLDRSSMNSGAVTIVYDGDGNRVAKTAAGVTTQYLVDDLNPTGYAQAVEELTGGSVQRTYTYGLQRISQEQIVGSAWTPSFYGYDGGGSVRQLTSAAGTVTDTYEYDAFGNHWTAEGSTPNNMFYRGEEYDSDLSLYYLRARYMNPLTGRFMSRDPLDGWLTNPKTLHKYLYAQGNPVNLADPTGKAAAAPTMPGQAGGDAGEYARLILSIAIRSIPAVAAVGCALNIQYAMDALKTAGEVDVVPAGFCSAKGKRWTCLASGHYVNIQTQNTTLSPDFTGYGNSETAACQAALDAFQSSAPLGSYPRHGRCTRCWKQ
jgi:RHS repeat-associated protein